MSREYLHRMVNIRSILAQRRGDSHDVLDDDLFGDDGRGVLGEVPLGSPFPSGGHTLTLLLDSLVYCLGLGFLFRAISAV